MMRDRLLLTLLSVLLVSCAQSAHQSGQYVFDEVLPKELQKQVDRTVSFSELRANPDQHQGKVVMLGGIVLDAKRKQDHTEIEVLELPEEPGSPPTSDRTQSEGRFLAVKDGLDPATLGKGDPITVVGRVTGKAVKRLDEVEYTYPVLETLHLVDWTKVQPRYAGYGYGSPYYRYGYPYYYGGPLGYSPFWYGPYYAPWGYYPYPFFGPGLAAPPSPPPSQSPPPRFRRR